MDIRFMRLKSLMFAFAALGLVACSDEAFKGNGGDNGIDNEATLNKANYTVYSSDQSRVINYNDYTVKTRGSLDFEMPALPSVPSGAPNMDGTNGTLTTGVEYVIENYNGGWITNGATVYITGDVNITWWNAGEGGVTIYIMPDATLTFNSTITPGTTIYNYGTMEGSMTLANDVTIYSSGALTFESLGMNAPEGGNLPARIYSKEVLLATGDVRLNGEIYACGVVTDGKIQLNDAGTFKVGYLKAKNLEFNAATVILDNNGLIDVEETIFFSNADTRIEVEGNKAVMAATSFCTNDKNWVRTQISKDVYCWVKEAYVGSPYWRGETIDLYALGLQNSDINSEENGWVPAEGCHGKFGNVPETPENPSTPLPGWRLIKTGEIEESPDAGHDHNSDKENMRRLSATCIDGDGSNFYASYHMRGLNYDGQDWAQSKDETEGCIEYFTVAANGDITLQSFMWTQDYDFNHILLDNDKILTVGHSQKKGAILGQLPLEFTYSIGDHENFRYTLLTTDEQTFTDNDPNLAATGFETAGDGNCVIKLGNDYYVTTSKGYMKVVFDEVSQQWIQPRDYSEREKGIPYFGRHNDASVKHIISDGNGGVIMLALDQPHPAKYDATTESTASLISYSSSNLGDFPVGNPTTTQISAPAISPIDGKNVIALDPSVSGRLYACMGNGGLVVLDNGTVTKTWKHKYTKAEDAEQEGQESKLPVNGVAVDDNFIYVANGNLVSVLDKELNEIATYHADPNISANYIKLSNGYIYVAYGQDGILQLQLQETLN